jgi:pimeloyl-ACP methyl ester carboxylesterase
MRKATEFIIHLIIILMTSTTAQSQPLGKYASVNGIEMYYEIHGSGSPLVLIHGGGSTINTSFGRILPMLAKKHQVIALEMQAHGHTSDRHAPETFEQDAADIVELLRQLNIPAADILGFSNGGHTAIALAISHPEKVRRLVIASAFYKRSGVPAGFWLGFDNPKFSDMPQVYKDEYLKIKDQKELMNMFNKDVERMRTFKDWNEEAIRSIQAPALVVIGDQDLTLPEHAVEMYRLLTNGRLAIFPGNHGSYIGEAMSRDTGSKVPELFVACVDEFLTAPVNAHKKDCAIV